jgi:hypothetical protein
MGHILFHFGPFGPMIHILALDDPITTNEGKLQIEQLSLFFSTTPCANHTPTFSHLHAPIFFASWHVYTLWNNTKFFFHIKPHTPINLHAYKISPTYEQVIFPYLPQILHFTM